MLDSLRATFRLGGVALMRLVSEAIFSHFFVAFLSESKKPESARLLKVHALLLDMQEFGSMPDPARKHQSALLLERLDTLRPVIHSHGSISSSVSSVLGLGLGLSLGSRKTEEDNGGGLSQRATKEEATMEERLSQKRGAKLARVVLISTHSKRHDLLERRAFSARARRTNRATNIEFANLSASWASVVYDTRTAHSAVLQGAAPSAFLFESAMLLITQDLTHGVDNFIRSSTWQPLLVKHYGLLGMPVNNDSFCHIRPIGKGAYGQVWASVKRDTGKVFAVKVMGRRLIISKKAEQHILDEQARGCGCGCWFPRGRLVCSILHRM